MSSSTATVCQEVPPVGYYFMNEKTTKHSGWDFIRAGIKPKEKKRMGEKH